MPPAVSRYGPQNLSNAPFSHLQQSHLPHHSSQHQAPGSAGLPPPVLNSQHGFGQGSSGSSVNPFAPSGNSNGLAGGFGTGGGIGGGGTGLASPAAILGFQQGAAMQQQQQQREAIRRTSGGGTKNQMKGRIREVWRSNLHQEVQILRSLVDKYPYISMDTEFPGIVARPMGAFTTKADYHYQTLRCNVDLLKVIQLGITLFSEDGDMPPPHPSELLPTTSMYTNNLMPCPCTWQFNFQFSVTEDMSNNDSIEFLAAAGLDLAEHQKNGIDAHEFGAVLITSGLVLLEDVRWISFHSGYDFGYLVKLMLCKPLPDDELEYRKLLSIFFPSIYDIKFMVKHAQRNQAVNDQPLTGQAASILQNLGQKSGLQDLADELSVKRIGIAHQAGSDSLLTGRVFWEVKSKIFGGSIDDDKYLGQVWGLNGAGSSLTTNFAGANNYAGIEEHNTPNLNGATIYNNSNTPSTPGTSYTAPAMTPNQNQGNGTGLGPMTPGNGGGKQKSATMVLERLKQVAQHVSGTTPPPHPFDPLSGAEIENAVKLVRQEHGSLYYNAVTLLEPRKKEMLEWLADPDHTVRPHRVADVVAIGKGSKVYDALVDLDEQKIVSWELMDGVQPLITMEDLQVVEHVVRVDPKVIEQCGIIGIPKEDMHKVYCDPWTIGFDERFGNKVRLQQALMYYRPHIDDSQYSFPLDFTPIFNSDTQEIIHIDVPPVRRPLNQAPVNNYHPAAIEAEGGYRKDLKPINITQPEGVSFKVEGRIIEWQNWKVHVGFNYREGIVLNNITYNDKGNERGVFYRLSLAEMVVPYGNPEHPHQRKHAFDLGEYGGGYMTNSLALGCDCKGAIHYMDADFVNRAGSSQTIKNAICIHEEDAGILFKHTDFRDDSVVVTRGRKLLISHIFTAANYEYCVYWIFHQDGTVQLEIKLTGILNTYSMNPGEDTKGWGTEVYPGVNAHNHQHLFCMRIDPNIDGPLNTVFQVDAKQGPGEVGSAENKYGNAFYAHKTKYTTAKEAMSDYDGSTSRTWEMANTNKINPYSHKPVSYKLVSREVPALLPKKDGLVWNRAGFARHAIHVTKYEDDQLHPAGRHVPQTSGIPSAGLPTWIDALGSTSIENTDIVLWHTFGITHFPSPEDFPIMPAEPMTLLLRPRNFFLRNPALDVPPSYAVTPSQKASFLGGLKGSSTDGADKASVRV